MACLKEFDRAGSASGDLPPPLKSTDTTITKRWKLLPTSEQTRIPHIRPRPGRRRRKFSLPAQIPFLVWTMFALSALWMPTLALNDRKSLTPRSPALDDSREGILIDSRPAPARPRVRRDLASSIAPGKVPRTNKADTAPSTTSRASADASTTTVDMNSSPAASSTPVAFDGGLGTNYTQPSCPTFMTNMINNKTFVNCLPFSILLQNSMSFFSDTRSIVSTNAELDASCNVVFPECSALMSSYAVTLRSPSACSDDFDRENPIIRQAYNGLLAYDSLYHASCIKAAPTAYNDHSANYCFADAITNTSSPTDSYIYYLPVGVGLPSGSAPTCNQCLKDTMGIIATTASNKSQPASLTYVAAAQMVNRQCGPSYVNASIPPAAGGGKSSSAPSTLGVAGGAGLRWVWGITVVIGGVQMVMSL